MFLCLDISSYFFVVIFFFFKQKTAYEMRISDWSSDVCSSDLGSHPRRSAGADDIRNYAYAVLISSSRLSRAALAQPCGEPFAQAVRIIGLVGEQALWRRHRAEQRDSAG